MDKMCNRVCEIIADYETDGVFQSELWKKAETFQQRRFSGSIKIGKNGDDYARKNFRKRKMDLQTYNLKKYQSVQNLLKVHHV